MPAGSIRVISMCAGQGRDLLGGAAGSSAARRRVGAAGRARSAQREFARRSARGLSVEVVEGDASLCAAYQGFVPADLVLVCGVFGTSRTRTSAHGGEPAPAVPDREHGDLDPAPRAADATPTIRQLFAEHGFRECRVRLGGRVQVTGVGTQQLTGPPLPYQPDLRFVRLRRGRQRGPPLGRARARFGRCRCPGQRAEGRRPSRRPAGTRRTRPRPPGRRGGPAARPGMHSAMVSTRRRAAYWTSSRSPSSLRSLMTAWSRPWEAPAAASSSANTASTAIGCALMARRASRAATLPEPSQMDSSGISR